jgi:hypothetical protein
MEPLSFCECFSFAARGAVAHGLDSSGRMGWSVTVNSDRDSNLVHRGREKFITKIAQRLRRDCTEIAWRRN